MAILPQATAFAFYSDISSQVLSMHPASTVDPADDNSVSTMQHDDHCQSNKLHGAGCSFHVCVDCAITSGFDFIPIHSLEHYSCPKKPTSISLLLPPEIKPPIIVL